MKKAFKNQNVRNAQNVELSLIESEDLKRLSL